MIFTLDSSKDNKVLVHCYTGDTRSVAIVAAFMMKRKHWGYQKCLTVLNEIRPTSQLPNGFRI